MHILIFLLLLSFVLCIPAPCSSVATDTLLQGSSFSVERSNDILVSPNGVFSAGFFPVGDNAFCFSIWFARSKTHTLVWMANRDEPVDGRASKLTLLNNGNLVLSDAGATTIWSTATFSSLKVQLKLMDNGNLVLRTSQGKVLWQSFDFPTDTLLPGQPLTEKASLISSRSSTNFSSGFYKLYFDNDNVIRLLFKGPNVSSVYWPVTWKSAMDSGRFTYNITKIAVLDFFGHFTSSDSLKFYNYDYGAKRYRRFTVDPDGNLRLYSFNEENNMWEVSWQAISQPCTIHGICGANGVCTYDPFLGRTCYCLQGFKIKNPNDWTQGCEPEFITPRCHSTEFGFVHLPRAEFYGYDLDRMRVSNLTECENRCLQRCEDCKGFQFNLNQFDANSFNCFTKTLLLNGQDTPNFDGETYLKLPKSTILSLRDHQRHVPLKCSANLFQRLNRIYEDPKRSTWLNFLLWFACGIGALETTCIFLVWFFLFRSRKKNDKGERQLLFSTTGFQRFTYSELKKATHGFGDEIGRGAGGIVYKGMLENERVAAIKLLISQSNQGEEEFLAEISTIGMLNHMNLIDMWGYCVEGKHRLLVYEYMENGSLAENLYSSALDWNKRFIIAVGTARGLAYLHEECLEWVLHCDVKSQNILLDSEFQPKVADFGLSKLLNRDERANSGFSRIRGTRGYMAPEWVYNLRITSKVDVYSYGIVMLEMITGKSPMGIHGQENQGGMEQRRLVTWVKEKMNGAATSQGWIEEIADPKMEGQYDADKVEQLVKVALRCVEDNMDERPSMSNVVEMLQSPEYRAFQ